MKKIFFTMTSFNFLWFSSFNALACVKEYDQILEEETLPTIPIKSNLKIAKQFLQTNHLTIDSVFANKSASEYIEYIKKKHQDKIANEINFLFNENEFEILIQGNQQVLAILNDNEENETVNVKFDILPDLQVANNILIQAEAKLKENISGFGLFATSSIDQSIIDKIIKLVENQVNNSDVQVTWIADSLLNSLQTNKVNQAKVELSVKKEDETLLTSKVVEIFVTEILDSPAIAHQKLLEIAEQSILFLDAQNFSEKDDLSSHDFCQEVTNLLQTAINNPLVSITLLTNKGTLSQNNNQVKVKLSVAQEEQIKIEKEVDVTFSKVMNSQKYDNIFFLQKQLPEILKAVDGSKLQPGFSITDPKLWELINQTINNSNVKAIAPPRLEKKVITVEQNVNVITNNIGFNWLRGFAGAKAARRGIARSNPVTKPRIPKTRTIKTRRTVRKTKTVKANKKDSLNNKSKQDLNNKQTQKDSPEQIDKEQQLQYLQEKIEQAEELSQSFINQLVDANTSAAVNDYNIFALITVGSGNDAITDIVPVKLINVALSNQI